MLLQGMEGGWVVIEASHTVRSGLNVTCHMLKYIYHCNMKSIVFPIIFHSTTRNSMLKLLKECKKYSVNTYT